MTDDRTLSEKRAAAGRKGGRAKHRVPTRPDNLRTTRPIASLTRGRNDWYNVTRTARDEATISIYDEIGYFGVTAKDFIAELNDLDVSVINLNINSPGGDVFDANAIHTALIKHRAKVLVDIEGYAASAASYIAMAGDRIRIAKSAQFMIHDAWGLAIGNAEEMRHTADLLDSISDGIADLYAERTGRDADQWRALMKDETWFRGAEAVEAGLADELIERESDETASTFDLSVYKFAGRDNAPAPVIPEVTEVQDSTQGDVAEDVTAEADTTGKAPAEPETPNPDNASMLSVLAARLSARGGK